MALSNVVGGAGQEGAGGHRGGHRRRLVPATGDGPLQSSVPRAPVTS